MSLKEAFGAEFGEKIKTRSERLRRLDIAGDSKLRMEFVKAAKEGIKPNKLHITYSPEGYLGVYDLMLVKMPEEIRVREGKFSPGVNVRWEDVTLTCWIQDLAMIDALKAEEHYVMVGKYSMKPGRGQYEGRPFYNLAVHGMLSMEELAAFGNMQATQDKEIKEKIEVHKTEAAPVEKDATPEPES